MSSASSSDVRGGVPLGRPTYARDDRGGRGPCGGSGGGMVILGEIALGAGSLRVRSGVDAADGAGSGAGALRTVVLPGPAEIHAINADRERMIRLPRRWCGIFRLAT